MMKIDKLFGDKKGSTVIYILLAMGILLLVMGSGFRTEPQETPMVQTDSRTSQAERILSEIKGVGEVSVMLSEETEENESVFSPEKKKASSGCSVLIVAEGGADSRVREKIVRAAGAALGVDPHKIEVFERKE